MESKNKKLVESETKVATYIQRRLMLPGRLPKEPKLNTVLFVHLWNMFDESIDVYGNLEIHKYIKERKEHSMFAVLHTYDTAWLKMKNLATFLDIIIVFPEDGETYNISLLDMLKGLYPEFGRVTANSNVGNIITKYLLETEDDTE